MRSTRLRTRITSAAKTRSRHRNRSIGIDLPGETERVGRGGGRQSRLFGPKTTGNRGVVGKPYSFPCPDPFAAQMVFLAYDSTQRQAAIGPAHGEASGVAPGWNHAIQRCLLPLPRELKSLRRYGSQTASQADHRHQNLSRRSLCKNSGKDGSDFMAYIQNLEHGIPG